MAILAYKYKGGYISIYKGGYKPINIKVAILAYKYKGGYISL